MALFAVSPCPMADNTVYCLVCKAQGGHADGATGRRNNDPEYDPRRLSLFSELQQKASDRSFKDVVPIRRLVATYFDVTAANRLCCSL